MTSISNFQSTNVMCEFQPKATNGYVTWPCGSRWVRRQCSGALAYQSPKGAKPVHICKDVLSCELLPNILQLIRQEKARIINRFINSACVRGWKLTWEESSVT